jgi:CRISPR-associated protein Csm1
MDIIKQKIILAALLHDIGKFWQRGDSLLKQSTNIGNPNQEWDWLVPYNLQTNRPGYQHAIWTWHFFERFKEKFTALGYQLGKANDSIQGISAKHHRPDSIEAAIIQMADRWSSGIDRRKEEQTDEESENLKNTFTDWGKYNYKKIPLHSVFNDLKVFDSSNENKEEVFKVGKEKYFYGLRPLSILREDIFPVHLSEAEFEKRKDKDLQEDYSELWKGFEKEFAQLPTGSLNGFVNSLLNLLKKYTWCIPSSTMDMPNVSLFEHLKTTAAFASCLYDYREVNKDHFEENGWQLKLKENTDPVLMCCIDLSGIQKFIYDIASRKAFQSLKGRSFYLQLLIDNLLSYILEHPKINQTAANIIYSSGGMAYFLLPNTADVKKALGEAYSSIQEYIFQEHKGKIFPALSWVSFHYEFLEKTGTVKSMEALEINDLGRLWREVSERAAKQKRQRFKSLLLNGFNDFFSEYGSTARESQESETCSVTGEPLTGEKGNIGRDEVIPVLKIVERQTELGRRLKDCEILIHGAGDNIDNFHATGIPFEKLKRYSSITDKDISDTIFNKLRSISSTQFIKFNDTDFLPIGSTSLHAGYGFKFYGGNKQPESSSEDRPKTFEEMCLTGNGGNDFSKLGLLRMDVDNLGKIFIHGFDNQNKSFAAYATLSFLLDLFFSGYINSIWANNPKSKYKEHVSILYSGGDDLFALGRWDAILEFAAEVRKEFCAFTGRPDITLSAGIGIVDKKYPIYKAATMAGEAEDEAKDFESKILGNKNAICFFGETVSWNKEFSFVEEMKSKMRDFVRDKLMNRSLLHQLQRYKALKDYGEKRAANEGKPKDFSYKWHSAYYLKRFLERHDRKPEEVQELLLEMQHRLLHETEFENADRYLDLIALAARWAEYELKLVQTNKMETAEA